MEVGADDPAVASAVVDDSQFLRTVLSDRLGIGGVQVVATAADGTEAVEAVRDHRPDVLTMDLQMPDVDGLEGVERIVAERPTPILVSSAHAADGGDASADGPVPSTTGSAATTPAVRDPGGAVVIASSYGLL